VPLTPAPQHLAKCGMKMERSENTKASHFLVQQIVGGILQKCIL
jgi:hypothetical protein